MLTVHCWRRSFCCNFDSELGSFTRSQNEWPDMKVPLAMHVEITKKPLFWTSSKTPHWAYRSFMKKSFDHKNLFLYSPFLFLKMCSSVICLWITPVSNTVTSTSWHIQEFYFHSVIFKYEKQCVNTVSTLLRFPLCTREYCITVKYVLITVAELSFFIGSSKSLFSALHFNIQRCPAKS